MYDSFFGFQQRPFSAAPQAELYYPYASMETARDTLVRCIERSEGPGLLVASAGLGKSLLLQLLAAHFQDQFQICLLANTRLSSRRALLQAILFELGLEYRNMDEGELRLSLIDYVCPNDDCPNGVLLLVDEAHTVPLPLLEEMRMITNLVREGELRVRLVLAGSPELEENFTSPKLESFSQRLAARCFVDAMNREETSAYIRHQVSSAGGNPTAIFTELAVQAVYDTTGGIPRLINQLCDHALVMAAAGDRGQLDDLGIQEAWSDLQQLPAPVVPQMDPGDQVHSVVEFGSLDETSDDQPNGRDVPDETTPLPADPTRQLEEIEHHVQEAAQEFKLPPTGEDEPAPFEPAGQIGPETDFVAPPVVDPFAEPFDEEEVVIDRFVSLDRESLEGCPRVRSADGRELAALIAECDPGVPLGVDDTVQQVQQVQETGAPIDIVASTHGEITTGEEAGIDTLSNSFLTSVADGIDEPFKHVTVEDVSLEYEPVDSPIENILLTETIELKQDSRDQELVRDASLDPVLPQNSLESAPADVVLPDVDLPAAAEDVSPEAAEAVDVAHADDRDLIVVQDDPVTPAAEQGAITGGVKRQEYRQLFARLRHG